MLCMKGAFPAVDTAEKHIQLFTIEILYIKQAIKDREIVTSEGLDFFYFFKRKIIPKLKFK